MSVYLAKGEQVNTYFNPLDAKAFENYQGVARVEGEKYVMQFNKLFTYFKELFENKTLTFDKAAKIIECAATIRKEIYDLKLNYSTNDDTCEYIDALHKAVKSGRQAMIDKLVELER